MIPSTIIPCLKREQTCGPGAASSFTQSGCCPRPGDENELNEARQSPLIGEVSAELRAYPNSARIARLNSFERFVFIMSVLENYSLQECSLLLGCFRRDVINARTAAIRNLASFAIAPEIQPERKVIAFAGVNHANR
jgi:hypothetical protein